MKKQDTSKQKRGDDAPEPSGGARVEEVVVVVWCRDATQVNNRARCVQGRVGSIAFEV
jgi:hypothetical protein